MAETVLKFTPQHDEVAAKPKRSLKGFLRARLRLILLVVLPAIALAGGIAFYLSGGRHLSTRNAHVGAQKVLITTDIAGKLSNVMVREGQHVTAGQPLFEIDPVPYRLPPATQRTQL